MLNSKNSKVLVQREKHLCVNSRVKITIFFMEKISFSLKLFSDHFYGQSLIETVPGPLNIHGYYEGCSNMNASGFITFFTYMLRQNGKRFYKGLYVTFKVAPDQKKNTVYLSSYSPLNEGHVCILTNSMLRTSTSDRDERIILRTTGEIS